ncbi:MAG: hypothetical protein KAT68_09865 [Bacteroidales bacterium]|nr:hypothetical protein [Bacteroidales bacterium]
MTIDRIDWHSGGDYPEDLPHENGGTHIGFYISWILNNYLHGELHRESETDLKHVKKVINREITGLDFLISQCDEKFWDEDMNEEGNAFTEFYYSNEKTSRFYDDYSNTLAQKLESIYHVENTWNNYDKLAKVIDKRYSDWKNNMNKKW